MRKLAYKAVLAIVLLASFRCNIHAMNNTDKYKKPPTITNILNELMENIEKENRKKKENPTVDQELQHKKPKFSENNENNNGLPDDFQEIMKALLNLKNLLPEKQKSNKEQPLPQKTINKNSTISKNSKSKQENNRKTSISYNPMKTHTGYNPNVQQKTGCEHHWYYQSVGNPSGAIDLRLEKKQEK